MSRAGSVGGGGDEVRGKTPMAKIMTTAQFHWRFGTHEACLAQLKRMRCGENLERFACPACGHEKGWRLDKRQLVECGHCHHQASITVGTIFHRHPLAAVDLVLGDLPVGAGQEGHRRDGAGQADGRALLDRPADAAQAPRGHAAARRTLCAARTCGSG